MTNSEEKLRGQIFDLEDDLQSARSKNTQGVHVKKDMEKNYADFTLKIASCANKMDSDRFDYRDQPKPSNGSGEFNGAGQDGNTEDPFDIDTLDDENETIQYPNLSRYALETESQNDLREFTALKPPESVSSNSRSGYSSSSPVCTLPNLSADLSEDFDTETPLYNGNYICSDTTEQYQAYKDPNANAKPNYIDLQRRRRSNTYATKGAVRNEANKRSYSLVDSPVPLTPQSDVTPIINETYLEDESAFTPDGYEYEQAVDSSPSVTGVSEQSPEDLSYGLVDLGSTQDDSDSEFENFIEQRRDLHEDGRASPYYPREQSQESYNSNAQPYSKLDPAPRKVVMRQQKPQVQKKRQTMPPQNEVYTEYVTHRPPPTPKSNSRSNYQVPDPNLVLRPVASAEGQKYATTFRKRKTSNNTIAGYPSTSSHQLKTEIKYSNTIPTKDAYTKYHPEYSRVQGAHSAFQRYPVSHPHQGDISPEALSDDVYLNSQPYETTINSSDIMNTQEEFEPQYHQYHHAKSSNRRQSTARQAYVSPQHSAVTPVNQNYYVPSYDSSPVDSGIYSLHNFVERPRTVAAQVHYQHQDFYDDETTDETPSIDVKELVSHLQQQITFLSSRIKRFEDRKSSQSQELLSPHSETSPALSPPHSFRSPSAASSGSEGGRRKKHSPARRISPNFNSPLPSNHSKPAVYSQPDKFRATEQRFRYNLPQSQTPQSPRADSKSRMRELVRDMDRPLLHSQLSAPNINRPRFISKATSGQSEGERGPLPPRASPIPTPTTQHSLHPYTRHEASQNAFNVTRARSSMDASHSTLLPIQKKPVTRYQAPPPGPIRPAHSVSPLPRPILRTPRTQHPTESSRISDGYHYDEDSFKNKKSAIPRVAYKREYY